jgi:hypothetical protein
MKCDGKFALSPFTALFNPSSICTHGTIENIYADFEEI